MAAKLSETYNVDKWLSIYLPVLSGLGMGKNAYVRAEPPKELVQIEYLRVTAVQTLEKCPRSWATRYLDLESADDGESFYSWLGTAVHEICETYLRGQWELNTDRDHAIFSALNQAGVSPTEQVSIMKYIVTRLPHRAKVIDLEREFTLPLIGDDGPMLRGHIDLTYETDLIYEDDDTIIIRDHKTNRRARQPKEWEADLQTLAYGLAISELYPGRPRRFEIGYVNLGKVITWPITSAHDAVARRRLAEAWAELKANWERHGPDAPSSWLAIPGDNHCGWCPLTSCDARPSSKALMDSIGNLW